MFGAVFGLNRKRRNAAIALRDSQSFSFGAHTSRPCQFWTEFGVPRLAEVKLQRPSPLATAQVQKARA